MSTDEDRVKDRDLFSFRGYGCEVIQLDCPGQLTSWWNGYVTVPPDHPWHGKNYDNIKANVHGGLTYSGTAEGGEGWKVGFDTNHFGDGPRTQNYEYVAKETRDLARQAAEAEEQVKRDSNLHILLPLGKLKEWAATVPEVADFMEQLKEAGIV